MPTLVKQFEIVNQKGLHARAATAFVKVATGFESSVQVRKNGSTANGKMIMTLLILAAAKGSVIELEVEGADAEQAMSALGELIQSGFGEDS